jgi:iron(III) transport system permease protein
VPAIAEPSRAAAALPPLRRAGGHPLWPWLALLLCVPTLLPLGATLVGLVHADSAVLAHLRQYVLPTVAGNTLWLLLGVGAGTALLGTSLGALVALTDFPGRRLFGWLLVLPLAIPGYVGAVALIGLFDWSGPLASALRGLGIQAWPEFRSRGGVILTLSLALYPYVYLLARGAFTATGGRAIEAARALGMGPLRAFLRAALPLARPWIAAGVLLVVMETLADFGTVAAFNYDTFTSAIYKAWFAMFDVAAALAVAGVLLLLVLALIGAEGWSRRAQRFHRIGRGSTARLPLGRWAPWASLFCALVLLLAFVVPVGRLLWLAAPAAAGLDARWLQAALNSVALAAMAAVLTVLVAGLLCLATRQRPGVLTRSAARLATLGYGLPGALLAVGLYVPVTHALNRLADLLGGDALAGGGLLLLLIAYGVRFTAVAHAPIDSAWGQIRPSLLESARLFGLRGPRLWARVHLPLLRGGVLTAALLVMVDVMKELPITLMTRPFGWDTLATRVFEFSNEGQWAGAAVPALAIVAVGLLPVLWLERRMQDAP